jgi:hypothetical protein
MDLIVAERTRTRNAIAGIPGEPAGPMAAATRADRVGPTPGTKTPNRRNDAGGNRLRPFNRQSSIL